MSGRLYTIDDKIDAEFGPDLPLADKEAPSTEELAALPDYLLTCYCLIHGTGLDNYQTRGRHFQNRLRLRRAYKGERLRRVSAPPPPEPVEEPEEPSELAGYVYFVRCGGFIKIGFAVDVSRRLRTLATAAPSELILVHTVSGPLSAEREFHARFASQRSHRGWFRLESALLEYLRSEGCNV